MRIRILSQVLRAVAIALMAIATLSPVPVRALGTVTADGLLQVTEGQSVKNTQTNNINGSLEIGTGTSASSSRDTETEVSLENEHTTVTGETVIVTRTDVADTLPLRQAPSPSSVSTDAELKTYATGMLRADKNLSKVRFADDEVTLWYKQQAKLIGIIPITLHAKATATESGDVELRYPWYKFLTTAEREALEAKLEARAHAALESAADVTATANAKARLASELRMALAEQHELDAALDGELQAKSN